MTRRMAAGPAPPRLIAAKSMRLRPLRATFAPSLGRLRDAPRRSRSRSPPGRRFHFRAMSSARAVRDGPALASGPLGDPLLDLAFRPCDGAPRPGADAERAREMPRSHESVETRAGQAGHGLDFAPAQQSVGGWCGHGRHSTDRWMCPPVCHVRREIAWRGERCTPRHEYAARVSVERLERLRQLLRRKQRESIAAHFVNRLLTEK